MAYADKLKAILDAKKAKHEAEKLSRDEKELDAIADAAPLLVEAALKLDRPQAAAPVLDWMAQTGYTDPALAAVAGQLKSRLGR